MLIRRAKQFHSRKTHWRSYCFCFYVNIRISKEAFHGSLLFWCRHWRWLSWQRQRLEAFQEEFGLIRTRGKGQGMHIAKTKADKAPGQLLSHACLCPALPEGGSHPHAVGQKNAQQQA